MTPSKKGSPLRPVVRLMLDRFPVFIGLYFIAHLVLRVWSSNTLTIDESEQMLLSQCFSLGYNAQPPLYTWIQIFFFNIFGPTVFSIALLRHLFLFLLYLFVYLSAKEITRDKTMSALCSVSMVLLHPIGWAAQVDQIHSVAVTTAAAATLYGFLRITRNGQVTDYLLLGIAVGCGVLFKYNFVLLAAAMLIVGALSPELRKHLLTPKLLLTVVLALVLVMPHTLWFFTHMDLATGETLYRMRVDPDGHGQLWITMYGVFEFVVAVISFTTPFWIIFLVLFGRHLQPGSHPQTRWLSHIMVTILIMVLVIVIGSETTNVKDRWLQPYLFFFPLWAFLYVNPDALRRRAPAMAGLVAVVMLVIFIIIPLRLVTTDLTQDPRRENYPFDALAAEIKSQGFQSGTIVTQDMFIGGNLRLFFPKAAVSTPQFSMPADDDHAHPVLYVWHSPKLMTKKEFRATGKDMACVDRTTSLPYKHSRTMAYTPFYRICRAAPEIPPTDGP